MNRDISKYANAYQADFGFESIMVAFRRRLLLERLSIVRPEVVLEVGCGNDLLYSAWLKGGGRADCWVIVEPSEKFAENARRSGLPKPLVITDFLENAVEQVNRTLSRAPDMVICSSVLHEVPSSSALLQAIREVMGPQTLLHVNVPNSESFHRQLAHSMGLITDTKGMTERNLSLLQHRVYDIDSLKADLVDAKMCVREEGGYLIKPFTHAQMERVLPELGESVMDGLYELGKKLPGLASEIWVEAVLDDQSLSRA